MTRKEQAADDERLVSAIESGMASGEPLSAGEADALQEVIRRYAPAVTAMAAAMTKSLEEREAIVSDVFDALGRHIGSFDPAHTSFRTWFLTMAHRRAVLRLRSPAIAANSSARFVGDESEESTPSITSTGTNVSSGARRLHPLEGVAGELLFEAYFGGARIRELAHRSPRSGDSLVASLRRGLVQLSEYYSAKDSPP